MEDTGHRARRCAQPPLPLGSRVASGELLGLSGSTHHPHTSCSEVLHFACNGDDQGSGEGHRERMGRCHLVFQNLTCPRCLPAVQTAGGQGTLGVRCWQDCSRASLASREHTDPRGTVLRSTRPHFGSTRSQECGPCRQWRGPAPLVPHTPGSSWRALAARPPVAGRPA